MGAVIQLYGDTYCIGNVRHFAELPRVEPAVYFQPLVAPAFHLSRGWWWALWRIVAHRS